MLGRWGVYDPQLVSVDDINRASLMISDILAEEDEQTTITGSVFVGDSEGMTMAHIASFTPSLMKKSMVLWQEGYPMRPKGLHYINT
ncbi:hypothetical protein CGJ15_27120, partial [Vibrio parahaemolyticus]